MNKLGIGTILAITGITLTIAGLIIFPNAENSLAQTEHDHVIVHSVQIFDASSGLQVHALEKLRVLSSSSGNPEQSSYTIQKESPLCFGGGFLQQGELFWSMKKAKLNIDSQCGFIDIIVKATSTPEIIEAQSDCFSNNFFRVIVETSVDATFSGTVGGTFVSGDGQIVSLKITTHSCP